MKIQSLLFLGNRKSTYKNGISFASTILQGKEIEKRQNILSNKITNLRLMSQELSNIRVLNKTDACSRSLRIVPRRITCNILISPPPPIHSSHQLIFLVIAGVFKKTYISLCLYLLMKERVKRNSLSGLYLFAQRICVCVFGDGFEWG